MKNAFGTPVTSLLPTPPRSWRQRVLAVLGIVLFLSSPGVDLTNQLTLLMLGLFFFFGVAVSRIVDWYWADGPAPARSTAVESGEES